MTATPKLEIELQAWAAARATNAPLTEALGLLERLDTLLAIAEEGGQDGLKARFARALAMSLADSIHDLFGGSDVCIGDPATSRISTAG